MSEVINQTTMSNVKGPRGREAAERRLPSGEDRLLGGRYGGHGPRAILTAVPQDRRLGPEALHRAVDAEEQLPDELGDRGDALQAPALVIDSEQHERARQ